MKSVLIICGLAATLNMSAAEQRSPYLFINFEDEREFASGPLREGAGGLHPSKPEVSVVAGTNAAESRHLRISGAAVQMGRRFTGDGQTHLEAWVRPRAEQPGEGVEFLDFDGAAVALFASGPNEAEFHALHITENDNGFWIATGARTRLKDGASETWHSIHLIQHWDQGTWSLSVDGVPVLEGIGRGTCTKGAVFELWLYGTKAGEPCLFDDLLMSPLPPADLEKQMAFAARRHWMAPSSERSSDKKVGPKTKNASRRQHQMPSPNRKSIGGIKNLEMHVNVIGGGRHIGEFDSQEKTGQTGKFALYTPGYDEKGRPKPLELRLRCDAQMEEGASLAQIEWAVTEMPKEGGGKAGLRVIAHGTFEKGPTLTTTLPSEWSNKPLSIHCGSLNLSRR